MKLQVSRIVEANKNLFLFASTFLTLYDYIASDGESYVRYNKIKDEWENDFEKLTHSTDFFFSLREGDANHTKVIDFLLNGDLCETLF